MLELSAKLGPTTPTACLVTVTVSSLPIRTPFEVEEPVIVPMFRCRHSGQRSLSCARRAGRGAAPATVAPPALPAAHTPQAESVHTEDDGGEVETVIAVDDQNVLRAGVPNTAHLVTLTMQNYFVCAAFTFPCYILTYISCFCV